MRITKNVTLSFNLEAPGKTSLDSTRRIANGSMYPNSDGFFISVRGSESSHVTFGEWEQIKEHVDAMIAASKEKSA